MSVYHVLLHLQKRLPLGSFFRLLEDGGKALAPATKLLEVYAREQNREMLRDFYYSDDRRVESAVLSLEESTSMMVCLPSMSLIFCSPWLLLESKLENPCCQSCSEVFLGR